MKYNLISWSLTLFTVSKKIALANDLFAPIQDPTTNSKYSINYISRDKWWSMVESNSTALENGSVIQLDENFKCFIPDTKTPNNSDHIFDKKLSVTELENIYKNSLTNAIKIISEDLKDYCMVYANGFWTYQYCIGNAFTQFHGTPGSPGSLYYTLGRAPLVKGDAQIKPKKSKKKRDIKLLTHDEDFQLLYNDFEYYVSEILDNGQICDLTGLPRITEVQYVCGSAFGRAAIQWVREVKTCAYEAQISIPALCDLELLSQSRDKKAAKLIYCNNNKVSTSTPASTTNSIIDTLGEYSPYFLGRGFYVLNPHESASELNRTVLLFTGNVQPVDDKFSVASKLSDYLSKALPVMLFHQAVALPDGTRFREGVSLEWVTEIVDIKFNHIINLSVTIDQTGTMSFVLDDNVPFPETGNFVKVVYGLPLPKKGVRKNIKTKDKIINANIGNDLENYDALQLFDLLNQQFYSEEDLLEKIMILLENAPPGVEEQFDNLGVEDSQGNVRRVSDLIKEGYAKQQRKDFGYSADDDEDINLSKQRVFNAKFPEEKETENSNNDADNNGDLIDIHNDDVKHISMEQDIINDISEHEEEHFEDSSNDSSNEYEHEEEHLEDNLDGLNNEHNHENEHDREEYNEENVLDNENRENKEEYEHNYQQGEERQKYDFNNREVEYINESDNRENNIDNANSNSEDNLGDGQEDNKDIFEDSTDIQLNEQDNEQVEFHVEEKIENTEAHNHADEESHETIVNDDNNLRDEL